MTKNFENPEEDPEKTEKSKRIKRRKQKLKKNRLEFPEKDWIDGKKQDRQRKFPN